MDLMKYLRAQWDRVGAVACSVLGLIVLLLGYLGTAGTAYIAEQVPYLISGGLFGIALLTVGAVLWLSADLRDEWRELARQGDAIRTEQIERRQELSAFVQQQVAAQLAASMLAKPARRRSGVPSSNGARAHATDGV